MRLIMTAMVRDEADIIASMLDHHLEQGVDHFVVTDNGSVDGTREILEDYASRGVVDLRHDPIHRKQQGATVTAMAREAYSTHGATWVINADADEFWMPEDRRRRLRDAFESIPTTLGAFIVPVIDMTGAPATAGTGLSRLRYRDLRPMKEMTRIGLHAHSTPNSVHIGSASVEVAQGNHYVNIESRGEPDAADRIEVLHLPWRSWSQYRRKVENAGRAYENNSGLTPSPNHHGMRDWRHLEEGVLRALYLARHPDASELAAGVLEGYFKEDRILIHRPDGIDDNLVPPEEHRELAFLGRAVIRRDTTIADSARALQDTVTQLEYLRINTDGALRLSEKKRQELEQLVGRLRQRKIVRLSDALARALRR